MSSRTRLASAVLGLTALTGLCACTQTAAPPGPRPNAAASTSAPAAGPPATGGGCAGEIARTRAIVEGDIATGNAGKSVGTRFTADLDQAQNACSAGRDAEAIRMVQAAKARYGYNR